MTNASTESSSTVLLDPHRTDAEASGLMKEPRTTGYFDSPVGLRTFADMRYYYGAVQPSPAGGLGRVVLRPTPVPRLATAYHDESMTVEIGSAFVLGVDENPRIATPSAISANWARLVRAGLTQETNDTLFRLADRPAGWRGSGSRALTSGSLRAFLDFWRLIPNSAEPRLSLAPNGNLVAEWYKSRRRHADMEFCDDGTAFFGIFNGRSVVEGIDFLENLVAILNSMKGKPLQWGEAYNG